MHWLFAFLIVLSGLVVFLSIPSIIAISKIGIKDYIKQIKYTVTLYSKIGESYCMTQTTTYNIGHSGRTFQDTVTNFFYPIYKDIDTIYVIYSAGGFMSTLQISEHKWNKGTKWSNNVFDIKTSPCIVTQLLIDRFKNKLAKFAKNSTHINDVDELNEIINSNAVSNKRESIIDSLE